MNTFTILFMGRNKEINYTVKKLLNFEMSLQEILSDVE
jgi:hypothetical protein